MQVTQSESRHRPCGRLPFVSARPTITSVSFIRWRHLYTDGGTCPIPAYCSFIDPVTTEG